jgi:predicted Zn finger-like uncharacterized protein
MRVTCPSCQATYNLDERRIPPGGAKLKCTKCQNIFPVSSAADLDAVPLPGSAGGPAPVAAPVSAPRLSEGAVPLPGLAGTPAANVAPPPSMTTGVIPLPSLGLGETALPRLTQQAPAYEGTEGMSMTTGVIPLPPNPTPSPGPLPAHGAAPRIADRTVFPIPPPAEPAPRARGGSSVPLPGPSSSSPPPRLEPQRAPPALPEIPETEPATVDEVFASPPPAAAPAPAGDEGFADVWGASPEGTGASRSFGEVELEAGNANATDFPIPEDFEPAQPGGFAWEAPPAPPPAASTPAISSASQPGSRASPPSAQALDPLEFDPSAPPQDDLEADLTSPLPRAPAPTSEPEDGLEMLGFLEDAAKDSKGKKGKVLRFHIRRRSGKVFGPFDDGVIAKMLGDGQLLGNEDVSTDQENWAPLGSVPGFAQVMQKLVARTDAPAPPPSSGGAPPPMIESSPADLERLRQVYEGRMAVVSSMVGSDGSRRRQLLVAGAIAGAVLLVVGVGASLGLTRFGPFATKWLFPPRVSAGSPEASKLAGAREALAQDTFAALKSARTQLEELLATREVPEVRAVWVQAVTRLQRQYDKALPGDASTVARVLEGDLSLMSKQDPERIKASAGAALANRQPDRALNELAQSRSADADLVLLRGEATLLKNQPKAAVELLEPLSKSAPSARVWHALGVARQAAGDVPGADAAFTKALAADPKHVSSALERASLALVNQPDPAAALAALAPLLEPAAMATLSPAEQARALTIQGMALLAHGDTDRGLEVLERAVQVEGTAGTARGALARAYLTKHDLTKALPLLTDAVEKEPQNPGLAEALVNALLELGRPQEAEVAVTAALAQNPADARLLLLSGRVNEALDRLGEAEAKFKAALAADPNNPEPALALGRFFLRFRRTAEARAQFDALAERLPDDARVRVGLGDLAMADGDVAKARAEYAKASTLDPKFAPAWLGLSRVDVEQQHWGEALSEADRALTLESNVVDGRLQRGVALWHLKDLDAALKEMEAARTTSGNLKVNVAVGALLLDKGDLTGAETALNQALKVEPSNPEANYFMARVHAARSEWTSAIESMRAALDRVPGRASYHYELGRIYRDAKKIPEAIEEWKTCVKLNPRHADAHTAMGEVYQDAQRYDDAIVAYDAALKADPTRTALLVSVGDCYAQTNHWTEALARYQQALARDPKLNSVYFRIARSYAELGDQGRAIPFYVRATVAEPQNALAYYHLGYAYKDRGRKREAVAAFRAFLQKSPQAKERQEVEDEILDLQGH